MLLIQAIRILGTASAGFLLALMLTPAVLKLIDRWHLKKKIRSEKQAPVYANLHKNKAGTPTGGGMIIWLTILLLAIIFSFNPYLNFIDRAQTYLPLAALFVTALIGLFDDLNELTVKSKVWIFFLLGLLGAWWFFYRLEWDVISVPFFGAFNIGWWYIPVFTFVIFASAFSANETDGLDGLAGGVLLFAFAALTVVAFALGRYDLAALAAAVIGALLAFLWFNIYPARFFMGDTGSMSLGITMGIIAMLTNTALLLPFFAPILILESGSVILQLISRRFWGRKIFLSTPIHHHFEAIGWPEAKITMRFWIISAVFAGLGLVIFFLNRVL